MERCKIYKVDKTDLDISGYDHYFVFLENHVHNDLFIGIMLTHSPRYGNIQMNDTHFKTHNANGEKYDFQYDNTKFVKARLIKDSNLPIIGPKGELTEEGLAFIEHCESYDTLTWEEAKAAAINT
jgi:hypothetical protein